MDLTDETFLAYAAKHYDRGGLATDEEFKDDLKRFHYLRRLLKRYREEGDIRVRLVLNHFIILYNCFGARATGMLFLKLDGFHAQVKSFAEFLSMMPEMVEYGGRVVAARDIEPDPFIARELEKI